MEEKQLKKLNKLIGEDVLSIGERVGELSKKIWTYAQNDRDNYFLELLEKEGCSSERLEQWKVMLSNQNNK